MSEPRMAGRTAFITGASRGIGRAIAEAYGREGAELVLSATSLEGLASVKSALEADGVKVHTLAADLSDMNQVEELFQKAVDAVGGNLDVLVNNAGIYKGIPFEKYAIEDLDRLMKVNVYAVFRLTQLAVLHMRELGGGKIVQISSTAGKWESPNQAAYNTTKHAVVGMSKCVALENGPFGINVNTICPYIVETDMRYHFEVHAEAAGVSMEQLKAGLTASIPIRRFLEPEENAHMAVYLGSKESDGMTGQTITISGGMRMG